MLLLLLLGGIGTIFPAHAADDSDTGPHLPLPRWATLRSDEVNMRTGPGTRYPIEWVYKKRGLPVEVVAEYDIWRRVRDREGTEGWIHKTELTGKRGAVIIGAMRDLHDERSDASTITAHLEVGAMGQLMSCQTEWCKVKFGGIKGYLHKGDFWGAYPTETFD